MGSLFRTAERRIRYADFGEESLWPGFTDNGFHNPTGAHLLNGDFSLLGSKFSGNPKRHRISRFKDSRFHVYTVHTNKQDVNSERRAWEKDAPWFSPMKAK
jgi:hypothetical protein